MQITHVVIDPSCQVNGCAGKMGKAVAEAAVSAGLELVPASFCGLGEAGQLVQVSTTDVRLHGPSEKEEVLSSVLDKHPNVIIVDFTVPDAVNRKFSLNALKVVTFLFLFKSILLDAKIKNF